jgi:transposase-like protein
MPKPSHPAWKRAYAIKAARINEATSVKAVAKRLGVTPHMVSNWRWRAKRAERMAQSDA